MFSKRFSKVLSSQVFWILSLLFFLAFFLRFYLISDNLFFGPEQGRDLLVVRNIVEDHKFTLIGARTEIEGIFYGPAYYYLVLIPFVLSRGDPIFIEGFLIGLSSLTVFIIYFLGKELYNKRVGLLSAALFTFSFGLIVFSRWLSHPPLVVPLSCLFFLFLNRFLKGDKKSLIFLSVIYGISGQMQFLSYIFLGAVLLLSIIIYYKKFLAVPKLFLILNVVLLGLVAFGPVLLFDLRHNFLVSTSMISLVTMKSGFYISFFDSLRIILQMFLAMFTYTIIPVNAVWGFLVLLFSFAVLAINKNIPSQSKIILVGWIVFPILIFILLRHAVVEHYFLPFMSAWVLLVAIGIEYVIKKINREVGLLLCGAILLCNLFIWNRDLPGNKNIIFQLVQPGLKYSDQIKTLRYIAKESEGKPFELEAYTIPYWLPQAWEYLFWYYNKTENLTLSVDRKSPTLFIIIQKDQSNSLYQDNWISEVAHRSGLPEKQTQIGVLTVEKINKK